MIASLTARSSSTPTQHQREIAEAYTLPPHNCIKSYNLQIFTFLSLTSDSQGKEFQVFSPVLLLLRRPIAFREGLWRGVSDSVIGFKISLTLLGNYLLTVVKSCISPVGMISRLRGYLGSWEGVLYIACDRSIIS
jgi:hypothetical protein